MSDHHPSLQDMEAPIYTCIRIVAQLKGWGSLALPPQPQEIVTAGHGVIAAEAAGLDADLSERKKIKHIKRELLPCIMIMQDGHACVLKDYKGKEAIIVLPETGGENSINVNLLQQEYLGEILLLKKPYQAPGDLKGNARYGRRATDELPEHHWLWHNVKRFLPVYSHVIGASLVLNLFAIAMPLYIMNIYDRVVPNQAISTLVALSFGIVVLFAFEFIMRNLRAYFVDLVGRNVDVLASSRLFRKAVGIRLEETPVSTGGLINNIRDFDQVRDFFTSGTLITLIDVPFILIFILIIAMIGGPIALIPLAAIPLVLFVSYLAQKPLQKAVANGRDAGQHKQSILFEALSRIETVKAMNASTSLASNWEEAVATAGAATRKARMAGSLALTFTQLVGQLVTVGVVIYGVIRIGNGDMTVGALVAATILTGRALSPLGGVAAMLTRWQQMRQSLSDLNTMMALPVETVGKGLQQCEGALEFRGVTFSYHGAAPALKNVAITIQGGERVAILGRVGSGKSTLARLASGMAQPTDGHVLLDGKDLRQIDTENLRRFVTFAPQEPALFQGTIETNIGLGLPPFYDEQIEQAADLAGVTDFTNLLPEGLEAPVLEMGRNFSGGQRQAVHLARALARNPKVLILDEPTAQYDTKAEALFKQRMQPWLPGRTLLVITHRSSLLSLVDRIIVLEQGVIVADGPKEEVLKALQGEQPQQVKPVVRMAGNS